MARQTRNYENGYLNKIAYHMACDNHESVEHFTERQIARYGHLTSENMAWLTREVASIKRIWAAEAREFEAHIG